VEPQTGAIGESVISRTIADEKEREGSTSRRLLSNTLQDRKKDLTDGLQFENSAIRKSTTARRDGPLPTDKGEGIILWITMKTGKSKTKLEALRGGKRNVVKKEGEGLRPGRGCPLPNKFLLEGGIVHTFLMKSNTGGTEKGT